jgi:hypothetical protein
MRDSVLSILGYAYPGRLIYKLSGSKFESLCAHQSVAARQRFPGAAPNTHGLAPSRRVDSVSGFSHSVSTDVMAVLSLHPEITFPRKRRPI